MWSFPEGGQVPKGITQDLQVGARMAHNSSGLIKEPHVFLYAYSTLLI